MALERIYSCISFEQITGLTSAKGLTAANIPPTKKEVVYALIQTTGSSIRFRLDGTDPDTGVGHYLATYGTVEVWGQQDLNRFRAIETTGTAVLEVHYFGSGGG